MDSFSDLNIIDDQDTQLMLAKKFRYNPEAWEKTSLDEKLWILDILLEDNQRVQLHSGNTPAQLEEKERLEREKREIEALLDETS
ncbi:MAG: hypothetical protein QNL05_00710 [Gammaproteobacteria bacterium]|nr:hypothetical protein [Gammaproteobacteria bacterium]MDX2486003.1 hypothetical protein [Gammaproteobacteria bacterium]